MEMEFESYLWMCHDYLWLKTRCRVAARIGRSCHEGYQGSGNTGAKRQGGGVHPSRTPRFLTQLTIPAQPSSIHKAKNE